MDKYAAEKIASEYYGLGARLAIQKLAMLDTDAVGRAMDQQRALLTGSAEERIGSSMERKRREGALVGTIGGGILGATGAGVAALPQGKELAILAALLGGGAGAVGGNLLGRGLGLASGGLEGGLDSIPGLRSAADYVSKPLDEY